MRILYVSDARSIHTQRWAKFFLNEGDEVHVASFRDASIPGVTTHLLPTFGLGKLGYLLAFFYLRTLYLRLRPDVVHAQYVTSYGFLAALGGLHPLVLTAWGSDVLISPKKSCLSRWLASYAVKRADAVTTVASHMNPAVISLGASEKKVSAVPFGVDVGHFLPRSIPRDVGAPLRLICTRNFTEIYDVTTLISAIQLVVRDGLSLQADLVGDGPLRFELESQVAREGLSNCITFHGHVNHDQLAQLLSNADIFVSPALSDGNNVSLNEAMACALFTIATAIPANEQWIVDGVNGLLYPAGDARALASCIMRASHRPEWLQEAGKLNRNIVEERADWRNSVLYMAKIYSNVIARVGLL